MESDRQSLKAQLAKALAESPYLTTRLAAFYVRLSPRTLESMRRNGGGPPFRPHSNGRNIVYHVDDLDAWSATRRRRTTKDDKAQGELPLEYPTPKSSPRGGNDRADH